MAVEAGLGVTMTATARVERVEHGAAVECLCRRPSGRVQGQVAVVVMKDGIVKRPDVLSQCPQLVPVYAY